MSTEHATAVHPPRAKRRARAVSVEEVTKDYGKVRAVNALSLDIPRGQIMALLGKNGAGKSTLIDIILGLQAPTSGTARVFGLVPRDAIRRSLVGVVLQTGSLPVDYTVAEALHLFGSTHDAHVDYGTILEETQLAHMSGRVIRKLSGGEQQRVRLALALLPDPHLLILDEPTAGMDATARREFWDVMRTQAERGRTIVFATHYLTEAQDFAERTVIIKDGSVIKDAPTDELRRMNRSFHLTVDVDPGAGPRLVEQLRAAPEAGAWKISTERGRIVVDGDDTDPAARILLSHPEAHGLEITASSLEDVFTSLTA